MQLEMMMLSFVDASIFSPTSGALLLMMKTRPQFTTGFCEWMGVSFVLAGILHFAVNWPDFLSNFRSRMEAYATMVLLIIALLLLIVGII